MSTATALRRTMTIAAPSPNTREESIRKWTSPISPMEATLLGDFEVPHVAAAPGQVGRADERREEEHGGDLEREEEGVAVLLRDEEDADVGRRPAEVLGGERQGGRRRAPPRRPGGVPRGA